MCREPGTEALSVSVYRLSTHLGGLKSTTRPGSVSASMQALLAPAQPPRGFRISVVGIELGVSTIWVPTPERRDSGLPEVSKVGSLFQFWSDCLCLQCKNLGKSMESQCMKVAPKVSVAVHVITGVAISLVWLASLLCM